jgi:hypothetical protein
MSFDLVFHPSGCITAVESVAEKPDGFDGASADRVDGRLKKVANAFATAQG